MIDNVTIGADIEVFLQDKDSGEIISAEGIIKGTKEEPFRFVPNNAHFATSLDNIMAEFCIPPCRTDEEFSKNIQFALAYIDNCIKENNLITLIQPAARINEKYLQTENAKLFGCDPDYNVWNGLQNMAPMPGGNLRSCGAHIHIGYEHSSEDVNEMLIKAMDIFVGIPSVIAEPDNERKLLYGKAGSFRKKVYGVEYRTVSNYYVTNESMMKWIFNSTKKAIKFVNEGGILQLGYDTELEIQRCINNADKDLAEQLIKRFEIKLAA